MKALTKEDLDYILQGLFRLSQEPNNSIKILPDGLYNKDFKEDFTNHELDEEKHINAQLKQILNGFSFDENNNLLYNETPVNIAISKENDNAIQIKLDGIYVKSIPESVKNHLEDNVIHSSKEEKEIWNKSFENAKNFVMEEIRKLDIYDILFVSELPTENISITTLYVLTEEKTNICVLYLYRQEHWFSIGIQNSTLLTFITKDVLTTILKDYVSVKDSHEHKNLTVLDKFSEDSSGNLLYQEQNIQQTVVSKQPNNAIQIIDGQLFVEDFTNLIRSLSISAAFSKYILLKEECSEAKVYSLRESIDNFNLLLIEYYYKSDKPEQKPGYAKTAIIDVDTINELYEKGIDYVLELGYGISNSNCKIHMHQDKLWVNYYHNICIYKIIGIRKGNG